MTLFKLPDIKTLSCGATYDLAGNFKGFPLPKPALALNGGSDQKDRHQNQNHYGRDCQLFAQ
jgi:hypothetical protein|nr:MULTISPECIES: hypothetical protein [unclassified Iodidimonas]